MIDQLYRHRGYWSFYGKDVFISGIIIATMMAVVMYANYHIFIDDVRMNWNAKKCSPIYLPFAGYIMPEPGKTTSEVTMNNFNYCLKEDVSSVIKIAMMPLEFALYMIVEMIDAILDSILKFIAFLAWLKKMLGGIFKTIYETILKFVIPVIEIVIKVRDSLAKINGIMVSSLFTTMTIYNIMVSGIFNIMHILNTLMIALGVVIMAMLIFAMFLIPNPFTIIIGLSTYIAATLVIVGLIIPTIVIYTMMLVFMVQMTQTVTANAPRAPSARK
jgi:hypothetical protein